VALTDRDRMITEIETRERRDREQEIFSKDAADNNLKLLQ